MDIARLIPAGHIIRKGYFSWKQKSDEMGRTSGSFLAQPLDRREPCGVLQEASQVGLSQSTLSLKAARSRINRAKHRNGRTVIPGVNALG